MPISSPATGDDGWRRALAAADAAPRCGARTRNPSARGPTCRNPAMPNGRCRMHGGKSTGPRTEEGRARCANTRWITGHRSAEWIDLRKRAMQACRDLRALIALAEAEMALREARGGGGYAKNDVGPHAPGKKHSNLVIPAKRRSRAEPGPRATARCLGARFGTSQP